MPDIHSYKVWILLALFGVLVILAALIIRERMNTVKVSPLVPIAEEQSELSLPVSSEPDDGDVFRQEVPVGIQVPGVGELLPPAQQKEIAVPDTVLPSAPGSVSNFRNFNISGEGGEFVPKTVIARLGDIININFTAVDQDYDILFPSNGMSQSAKQGQTKFIQFQAVSEGSFLYYCVSCGGPDSQASGKIIVVAE